MARRSIAVVTGSRADYGIYRPVLKAIQAEPDLDLRLMVCGMHLSATFGDTVERIHADGFPITERVETLLASDTPEAIAKSISLGVAGFSQCFGRERPDILLLLGDRYEMFSAAIAALPFALPIAHIHGGELTEGLIDDPIRHSLTKLSHLHLVSTRTYRNRVVQMGERPDRVFVTGAPGLDTIRGHQPTNAIELAARLGIALQPRPLLVTFHPVTLEYGDTARQIGELLTALDRLRHPTLFTFPNADTSGRTVMGAIERYVAEHPEAMAVRDLGSQDYFSMMTHAAAMVGNSSSGIIEAPSFGLPVVNIGTRQRGRVRARNVIDVAVTSGEIAAGIAQALEPGFRTSLAGLENPYGDGHAAGRIVRVLRDAPLGRGLIEKRFHDLQGSDLFPSGDPRGTTQAMDDMT
ncbi:UDP-N-acetylglucosamine 2-epimerase [Skermanella stibiiresistens SB22]|uniref:UDP-N-acetylglucosamine 2-epimerase n=1 Tax=Skermanella stibiiresistens SB22 TaxID=1385369 RepID=W9HCS9_9PROT|nr:UDP-N-acetylglucosamine 2-epimerase [Skermanella stibiiresistens]EWY42512.1 UDP-N-acetylglucosamine 2-epimerase [Skermanella stibiiresistens SB22]